MLNEHFNINEEYPERINIFIQKYIDTYENYEVSKKTLKKRHELLHEIFNYFVKNLTNSTLKWWEKYLDEIVNNDNVYCIDDITIL